MEWTSMVRDGAVHGEALVETNREGHGRLAGRRIVGGMRTKEQEAQVRLSRRSLRGHGIANS